MNNETIGYDKSYRWNKTKRGFSRPDFHFSRRDLDNNHTVNFDMNSDFGRFLMRPKQRSREFYRIFSLFTTKTRKSNISTERFYYTECSYLELFVISSTFQ